MLHKRAHIVTPLIGIVALAPILAGPWSISLNDDWTQIFAFQAYLHDHLLAGELPHRSHMLGAGFPIVGHPEYPILSPLTLPILAFGPVLGVKLNVLIVAALSALGMWLLARKTLELSVTASAYAVVALAFCVWPPAILHSGNYPQIYYLLLPLLAWATFARRPLVAGLIGATMLTDGHLNSVSCFLVLGAWALLRRDILPYVGAMCATAGLAAFKLLPAIALLTIEDRTASTLEIASPAAASFFGFSGPVDGFALGIVPWLLAAGAVIEPKARRPLALLAAVLGFFAIVAGATVIDRIPWRFAGPVAAVATALPLFWVSAPRLASIFDTVDPAPKTRAAYEPVDTEYFVEGEWTGPRADRPDLYVYYRRGLPILRWEDNFQLAPVAIPRWIVTLDGTLTENAEFRGGAWTDAGEATLTAISANALTVAVTAERAGVVEINQRWDGGWSCDAGPAGVAADVQAASGRLGVRVEAGTHTIRCAYTSWPLLWGSAISLLTLGLLSAARIYSRSTAARRLRAPG